MNEEQQFHLLTECEQLDLAFDELTALLEQQRDSVPKGIRRDLDFWQTVIMDNQQ